MNYIILLQSVTEVYTMFLKDNFIKDFLNYTIYTPGNKPCYLKATSPSHPQSRWQHSASASVSSNPSWMQASLV